MHLSTNFLNAVRLCLHHFPAMCFRTAKEGLLISRFREWSGAFFLLDFVVASDTVETLHVSSVTQNFSSSNLSSLTTSDSFSSFCICKCAFHKDFVFLSCHSFPMRNSLPLVSCQCMYLSPSATLCAKYLFTGLSVHLGCKSLLVPQSASCSVHTRRGSLCFKLRLQVDCVESVTPIAWRAPPPPEKKKNRKSSGRLSQH